MEKINAVITGVGGYVPDYILTNDEISKMVDTTDEWIMGRIGIKERRILKEEGLGTSYIARKAVKQLIKRTRTNPDDIDLIIVATTTPDYRFPSTASILCERLGLKRAFAFDMQAVCSGFLYALETGANFIRSGNYKKVVVVGAEKMSSIINYADRATCPIFGDGGAAVMLEPTTEDFGIMDAVLRTDGKGLPFLHIKAGGSICTPSYYTLDNQMHYIYQEGRTVFKYAVSNMADACESIIARNHLSKENIDWVIPHQANQRIITAVTQRLEVPVEKVMVNIERYGNTSAGTLPLCLWDFEDKFKKGDNKMILVLLGTQHNEFTRLLQEVENCIDNQIIKEQVIVQAGFTKYKSDKMEIFDMISKEELDKYMSKANLIITHGGVGSIIMALEKGKKVIAVPRLHEYGEHVNDHQRQIIKVFSEKNYLIGIQNVEDLPEAIKESETFEPNEYKNNNQKMLNIIEDFIEKV